MANDPTPELLPCPLCGGPAEMWRAHVSNPRRKAWIACMDRCCAFITQEHMTNEDAIAAWNRRSDLCASPLPPPGSEGEAERLRETIAGMRGFLTRIVCEPRAKAHGLASQGLQYLAERDAALAPAPGEARPHKESEG